MEIKGGNWELNFRPLFEVGKKKENGSDPLLPFLDPLLALPNAPPGFHSQDIVLSEGSAEGTRVVRVWKQSPQIRVTVCVYILYVRVRVVV